MSYRIIFVIAIMKLNISHALCSTYYIPKDCGTKNIEQNKKECWLSIDCRDTTPRQAYIIYHCPMDQKLYMTQKPGKNYLHILSVYLTPKGLFYTTYKDKSKNSKIISVLAFIDKETMNEKIVRTLKDGYFYLDMNGKLKILRKAACSKKTKKIEVLNNCFEEIEQNFNFSDDVLAS